MFVLLILVSSAAIIKQQYFGGLRVFMSANCENKIVSDLIIVANLFSIESAIKRASNQCTTLHPLGL